MNITLDEVKLYCRIDGTAEDTLILRLIDAAKEQLALAGVDEPEEDSAQYALAICGMVLYSYDFRGGGTASSVGDIPGFDRMVTQLRLAAEAKRSVEADE